MNRPTDIKWLLIDIGDVLLLKNRESGQSFSELLANELRIDLDLAHEVNKVHYTTMEQQFVSEDTFIMDLKTRLNYNAPSNIFTYFEHAYRSQVRLNSELMDFLSVIRQSGIKTAILSNTIAIYQNIQDELGINQDKGFSPIIYSWQVGMVKPNKDIFNLALHSLNALPTEVIFIDDKEGHLNGAREVGMKTVLFTSNQQTISNIRQITSKN